MFYIVEIPPSVIKEIDRLSDYVFRFSFSGDIAKKVYDNLFRGIFSLEFMPYRFQQVLGDYRVVVVKGSYRVFYKIDETNKKVIIIRVLRSEQDFDDIL
ncbi:MAG: type II toxin-antitoxin system RelE/ParE family toxin [Candidatus Peribacteria bacterium]|nr:MAG: type II toxin-antitoxin system RelE/ParE family toxin [Candidatus Peribacteria bacterium]